MGQGARPPVTRKLPFLKSYRDRHGRERHYFRKDGCPSIALPGAHGSKEFMEAYWRLREGAPKREIGQAEEVAGSFGALIALYYKSRAYTTLKDITKATYRNSLERFRAKHGKQMVKGFRQRHVVAMLEDMGGRQDTLRKVLRLILNHALERGWIDVHPMAQLRRPRKADKGFRAWTDGEVAAYEAKWPTGSRERLALALLLYTGQRRSDVVGMGRQHVKDGRIRVVQQKTGAELWIPLHRALKVEIEAAPKAHLNLLTTQYGEPFSPAGFTNWFRDRARAAGLDDGCTPHGLRKTAAVRLSEAGCTPHEIMAVTGHRNLSEVTLYTAAADQARLAADAMSKVEAGTKSSTRSGPVRQKARKTQ
jgi:integrase